jgi:hypothetical protein
VREELIGMPITVVEGTINGEPAGFPKIVCDWCGETIDDARDGNVYWYHDRPAGLFFNHKRCARPR